MKSLHKEQKMPIMALVNAVYAVIIRNPLIFVRAGLFPLVLFFIIQLWTTPKSWGIEAYYALRIVEWLLLTGLWTFYAISLQRFSLKGAFIARPSLLPKFDIKEGRFYLASLMITAPLAAYALYFQQPIFFHQPDLLLMGGITALDGVSEHLYSALIIGWATQLCAYVLPAISDDENRSLKALFMQSFDGLRADFSRLFAASIIVVLPLWILVFILRLILHLPIVSGFALESDTNALVWNLALLFLETIKIFIGSGLLATLWALSYGRWRRRDVGIS